MNLAWQIIPDLIRGLFRQLRSGVKVWITKDVSFRSAGLTYYAVFATIPLLSLLITISSIFINEQFVAYEVSQYIAFIFNEPVANRLQAFVYGLIGSDYSISLSIGGLIAFLYATTTYFSRLNQMVKEVSANDDVKSDFLESINQRFKSLGYALIIFFFIALFSGLQALFENARNFFPMGGNLEILAPIITGLGLMVSIIILAALLAIYYRSILGQQMSKSSVFSSSLLVSIALYIVNKLLSAMLSFSVSFYDYGIFSAMLSVIIWLYLINTVVLCGSGIIARNNQNREAS